MVKLVYFSDTHFCSKRPQSRIDEDFFNSQLKKFDEIITHCIDSKIDIVIHGGDFFDVPLPEYSLLNSIVPRLKRLYTANIPCYITYGSHDLFGYNLESIKKTGVGTLIHVGLLKNLIGPVSIKNISFYGIPALFEHSINIYKNIPPKTIVVTHNIITPEKVPFDHILCDDLISFNHNNIFLCAHYHKMFFVKKNSTIFVSTGPLVRTDKTDAFHKPNIIQLDILDDGKIKISRKILSHNSNVFDLKEKEESNPVFTMNLQNVHFDFFDLFDLTKKIASKSNISASVLNEALKRLEIAQKGLYDA